MSQTETDTQDDESSTVDVEGTIEEQRERVEEVTEDARETVEDIIEDPRETVEDATEDARERVEEVTEDARETVEDTVDDGLESVDDNVVDALSAVLETRAQADVYVALRSLGEATATEVAEQSGLYPETVDEALAELEDDEIVTTDEVGGETFYQAIAPTEVVAAVPRRLRDRVSSFFEADEDGRRELSPEWAPFRLIVEPTDDQADDAE